jgi:hypothetical protein
MHYIPYNRTFHNHCHENHETYVPLLFNIASENAIWKVNKNQVQMKLKRTHQLLVYDNDVDLLADNINTTIKDTEILMTNSKLAGLQVNQTKTKYMLSSHQNAGQNNKKAAKRSIENVAKLTNIWEQQ